MNETIKKLNLKISSLSKRLEDEGQMLSILQSALEQIAIGSEGEDPAEIAESALECLAVYNDKK